MAIRIYKDRIQFDTFSISANNDGISMNVPLQAGSFEILKNSGYTSGGGGPTNIIDKFPFATNANATDVGDLSVARTLAAGQSSTVSGYTSGGYSPALTPLYSNVIDKFPFASNANATDVGDLSVPRAGVTGQSSSVSGYTSGGYAPNASSIQKFPFATDSGATIVGSLSTTIRYRVAGQSSIESGYGYTSGGQDGPTTYSAIDKFPFATDASASLIGNLTVARWGVAGQSSFGAGYTSGGSTPTPTAPVFSTSIIDKFPFATDASATDVSYLSIHRMYGAGQSSPASGYTSGGLSVSPTPVTPVPRNTIDKFPFASDASATDVGDLTLTRNRSAGQQG